MAKKPTPLDYYLDKYENELLRKRYEEKVAQQKRSPEYIRDEKMRKLLQHNAEFQKQFKNREIAVENYAEECSYLTNNLFILIFEDLQGKEKNFENMAEIIGYYKTLLKFIAQYSAIVSKENLSVRINEEFFLKLIELNPYFLCSAPLSCLLTPNLPMNEINEASIQKYIKPRVEKTSLVTNKKFLTYYGEYFKFTNKKTEV